MLNKCCATCRDYYRGECLNEDMKQPVDLFEVFGVQEFYDELTEKGQRIVEDLPDEKLLNFVPLDDREFYCMYWR